ncbi:sugar ABC transporter substrate-binding protein [Nonomuraea sp. B1E8]|uniref:sugar ABC transporter substrate-binding protein n=1 Tax=unclassified Nonomuraea TaxID=2593643 RepID=UPI00325E7BE3
MPETPSRSRRTTAMGLAAAVALFVPACSSGPGGSGTAAGGSCATPSDPKNVKIYLGVGAFSSTYSQEFIQGAKAVAKSAGVPESNVKAYESNFDGQKHLNTFTGLLAAGGKDTAIVLDPASTAFTKPLVQMAANSGARILTLWNRPAEIHPWDFGGGCWVAHQAYDGVESGEKSAEALFESFGGKGNIVALNGVPDNPSAKGRIAGLKKALAKHPDVKLLDSQVGNWDQTKGQTITETWIGKYGEQIDGVWAANDGMALGAVEALRAHNLNSRVKVTGSDGSADALASIVRGDMLTSMRVDGYLQGAVTFGLAYAAMVGDVDPQKLSHAQRDFYLKQELATPENASKLLKSKAGDARYTYDALKKNFWADSPGQIVEMSDS